MTQWDYPAYGCTVKKDESNVEGEDSEEEGCNETEEEAEAEAGSH